jgi:hypothetical protein
MPDKTSDTMSRAQESGAYLGGIGTMLEVADVCLSCGEVHSDKQFGFRHGGARECPKVIMGRFPVISRPELPDLNDVPVRVSASRSIRDYETPPAVSLGSLPSPRRGGPDPRSRGMGVSWLPPPDLGEVI